MNQDIMVDIIKGAYMAKGMGDLMKQMQKMQATIEKMQDELATKTVEGSSGGGMVRVTANGKQEIIEIKIDPEVVNPKDVEMLEELILAAVNQARENAEKLQQEGLSGLAAGLPLPGLKF
jgi:DNA-binding YbaB/EbfC family protein